MKKLIFLFLFCCLSLAGTQAMSRVSVISKDPCISALVVNAHDGSILFAENENKQIYPASVLKLMDLLIILEKVRDGQLRLDDMVQVTREAASMGGSQVYLDPKEQFSVDDLLYALMIQSANDAAVALAIHVSGSTPAFIALMNQRAQELGMSGTHFTSVHGLPPSKNQKPDVTTAHDLAILARELTRIPETFRYTSTRVRDFRDGKFVMRTHNHLLEYVNGCDGLKTGYFAAAGFSIVATAERNGIRIISIVLGSKNRKTRDAKAAELLEKGFAMVPPPSVKPDTQKAVHIPPAPKTSSEPAAKTSGPAGDTVKENITEIIRDSRGWLLPYLAGVGSGIFLFILIRIMVTRKRRPRYTRY